MQKSSEESYSRLPVKHIKCNIKIDTKANENNQIEIQVHDNQRSITFNGVNYEVVPEKVGQLLALVIYKIEDKKIYYLISWVQRPVRRLLGFTSVSDIRDGESESEATNRAFLDVLGYTKFDWKSEYCERWHNNLNNRQRRKGPLRHGKVFLISDDQLSIDTKKQFIWLTAEQLIKSRFSFQCVLSPAFITFIRALYSEEITIRRMCVPTNNYRIAYRQFIANVFGPVPLSQYCLVSNCTADHDKKHDSWPSADNYWHMLYKYSIFQLANAA